MTPKKLEDLQFNVSDAAKHLKKIRDYCLARCYTIAAAESVTSGLIQAILSQAKDAQSFFQGGITVYNSAQKTRHLDIEPINAMDCNGVSPQIASELALNVSRKFCSQVGIGITGYASPVPEENILELFAYMAIAKDGKVLVNKQLHAQNIDAPLVQLEYAYKAIEALARALK